MQITKRKNVNVQSAGFNHVFLLQEDILRALAKRRGGSRIFRGRGL